jgi:hypothetical protein
MPRSTTATGGLLLLLALVSGCAGSSSSPTLADYTSAGYPLPTGYSYTPPCGGCTWTNPGATSPSAPYGAPNEFGALGATAAYRAEVAAGEKSGELLSVALQLPGPISDDDISQVCSEAGGLGEAVMWHSTHNVIVWMEGKGTRGQAELANLVANVGATTGATTLCAGDA